MFGEWQYVRCTAIAEAMQNKKVRLSVCRVWKLSPPLQLLACMLAHKTFALEGVKSWSWVSTREGAGDMDDGEEGGFHFLISREGQGLCPSFSSAPSD